MKPQNEVTGLTKEGNTLAIQLNTINIKLNKLGAGIITLAKVFKYIPAPEDIETASTKVLKGITVNLNESSWVKAVNFETGGRYSEAQLKKHLATLIGDGEVIDDTAEARAKGEDLPKATKKSLHLPK